MPKMYFRCAVLGGAGGFASFPPNPPFTSALAEVEVGDDYGPAAGSSTAGSLLPRSYPPRNRRFRLLTPSVVARQLLTFKLSKNPLKHPGNRARLIKEAMISIPLTIKILIK